ncbi:MAG: hypothetical protein DRP89_06165 [Candidatus Neomarinimicrobiota bacterium]|nr:MAG: hypothetical protein DRP89_06165 [Candidatus Neomarinimicrobiota bacterium]
MKKIMIISVLIIICGAFSSTTAQSSMIANITEDVQTDFGLYHPYPANFTPNVPTFTVESDFSNVSNFSMIEWMLNSTDSTLLLQNHFTVKKSRYKQLYDIYNDCTWNGMPIFVTTDAVLHTYHVLFDCFLSEIEVQKFIEKLDLLTETLISQTESVFTESTKPETKEAARRNLAFLCVAKKLLNGTEVTIPDTVSSLVDSELVLIENHDGFHYSPIFGDFSALDYSQFQPRGHYTKSEELKTYFKAMMWYGWTIFTMEPDLFGDIAYRHSLQALILTQMLYDLVAEGQPLLDLWDDIYEPTIFFVGKTDDPNIRDYKEIADQIYGANFLYISPDSIANSSLLNSFMTEAQKLPEPKIPNWIYGTFITYKGFRFMGQRFIPDSYMFAHLIYPYTGTPEHQRWMPKGLDIMAILGSDRAYTLLDSVYQETSYLNYPEKIAEFKTEFSGYSPEVWAQNLYWNWLYCLMPLLYEKGAGYPFFMQNLAWMDKELLTALASWAELRHDTILYAKQSMTPRGETPGPPKSYVEPNPHLYARLASLVRYTREGLDSRNLLLEGFQDKLDLFESLLLFLRNISIKELENIPLSDSEYENIFCFGKVMQDLVAEINDPQTPWEMDTDDMAVIADVHTDSNTDQCLEEGVGYPLEVLVIVNEGGTVRITRGAIFSYYEFIQPIADRLTDEAWREMLTGDTLPSMPEWVSSLMDTSESHPGYEEFSPDNIFHHEFSGNITEEIEPIPLTIMLSQNYPNPFNPVTTISYSIPNPGYVTLKIYDVLGKEIQTIISEFQKTGFYSVYFDASEFSSGIYFYRLETKNFTQTRKMILLR